MNLARPVAATKSEALNPKSETNPNHQNSKFKTNITAYFDGGYGSRIPISSRKNKVSVQADFAKLPADFINDGAGIPSR